MDKPFKSYSQNKQYSDLQNQINENLANISEANNINAMKYIEMVVSALLLEINKKFPEPNYSLYITYRFKSAKSSIEKLTDYITRMQKIDGTVSIKEISDLIGLRIIIEKIPHNMTINKNDPNYNNEKLLYNERKKNIKLSDEYHKFEEKVSNNECTYFEYYTKCKELLENMINMFSSEYIYSTNYASELTEKYLEQISECKKKITILTAMGDKNSKIDINNLDKNPDILNFHELLRDFDSRIDGKLALTLFSNSLPDIIGNSEYLKLLGVTTSNNPKRLKFKREKSGYISNFFGIDYSYISPKSELQVMSINEHQESTTGYSAHSNMPGKEANFMEIPTAYKDNNIKLLKSLGQNNLITNQELHLINLISSIKPISKEYMKLFQALVNKDYIHFEDKVPKGINLPDEYIPALKKFCHLTKIEKNKLEQLLYERGCNIFDSWAKNVFVK